MTCVEHQTINVLSGTDYDTRDKFARFQLQRTAQMPALATISSAAEDNRIYVATGTKLQYAWLDRIELSSTETTEANRADVPAAKMSQVKGIQQYG